MTRIETLLRDALAAAGDQTEPSEDLFVRIRHGIDLDRRRRRRVFQVAAAFTAAGSVSTLTLIYFRTGDRHMAWSTFELISFVIMATVALVLGPFIKRFGRTYAADVFRSNPSTGKSFIVLTDFAYYLIFSAYILFTTRIERPSNWSENVGAVQLQDELTRLGGILLIIGLLHGVNLLVLPVIGRLLTLNRRLDQQMRRIAKREADPNEPRHPDELDGHPGPLS